MCLFLVFLLTGCASWARTRVAPHLDVGFAAGGRVSRERTQDPSLVRVAGGFGATQWMSHGEGAARRYMALGGGLVIGAHQAQDPDVGAEILVAPPRADRHAGFQFRLGPRVSFDLERAGVVFAAEWAHWLMGALYAEASYNMLGDEGAFLFGARVNLLLPYTLIRVDTVVLD